MKSIALAAILATTAAAWATPAPATPLTHTQLVEIVKRGDGDLDTVHGVVNARLVLDLRRGNAQSYFVADEDPHGIAFICQDAFEDFAGGPVSATLMSYERGEDGRDYIKLSACTSLVR